MNYDKSFKDFVAQIYSFSELSELIKAIESNNHNRVRILLEKGIDDEKLYIKEYSKNRIFFKPKNKHLIKARKRLYSIFMTDYEKYLDNK